MPRHERPSVPSSDFRDWWSVELPGPNARSRVTQMSKDPAHYGCTDRGCTPVKKGHVARKPASRSSARSSAPWAALGVSLPLLWRIKRLHCVHPALLTAKVFQKTRPALLSWGARAQVHEEPSASQWSYKATSTCGRGEANATCTFRSPCWPPSGPPARRATRRRRPPRSPQV